MNASTVLALLALVAVTAGLSFYLGRITAPQPQKRPRTQTIVHMPRARLIALNADGEPVGPSGPFGDRQVTLHFEAQAVDPGALATLTGSTGGRHRAPDPDDTAAVPAVDDRPPNLLKPPDQRPEPDWPDARPD